MKILEQNYRQAKSLIRCVSEGTLTFIILFLPPSPSCLCKCSHRKGSMFGKCEPRILYRSTLSLRNKIRNNFSNIHEYCVCVFSEKSARAWFSCKGQTLIILGFVGLVRFLMHPSPYSTLFLLCGLFFILIILFFFHLLVFCVCVGFFFYNPLKMQKDFLACGLN